MSAEVLGTDLLGEVKVEGLDEVWRDHSPSYNIHRDHRLTFSSFYAPYKSSMPAQDLHLDFYPSIDSSPSFRNLPPPGSSNTSRLNSLLTKKGRHLRRERSHYPL